MNKRELLKALERFSDNAEIELVINEQGRYSPTYGRISETDYPIVESPHYRGPVRPKDIRISIDLPEDVKIIRRKRT